MKIRSGVGLGMVAALLVTAAAVFAHHSNAAQFDSTKRTTIKGTVTKIEWTNPHAFIYVVVSEDGKSVTWSLEGFPPNTLLRTGWKTSYIKQGDVVTVEGALARDGSPIMLAREVTLRDGQKLYWGPAQ